MNTSTDECILSLLFVGKDGKSVNLRVAASQEGGCGFPAGDLPRYIDIGGSENLRAISDVSQVDGETPVLIYTGSDPRLTPILLLENETYGLAISPGCDDEFMYLRQNSGKIALKSLCFSGNGGERIYTLCFTSYVGRGLFDVEVSGEVLSIPFEVRSRKIGYLSEYPLMLSDIAEFSTALLMNVKSPLHTLYGVSDARKDTMYEDFMVLDYVFSKMDLPGEYRLAKANRHSILSKSNEAVPAGIARAVDPSELAALVAGDNLEPVDGGPIAGRFAPVEVSEDVWFDDYDTPENRIVKDLLLTVRRMIESLRSSQEASPETGSEYVGTRLAEMSDQIEDMSSDPWLRDVGEVRSIPFGSTVLQGRAGYSGLFRIYQIIGMGAAFRQEDAEMLMAGQNKKLYTVYEYWCYTRLYRCLSRMSSNSPEFPLKESDGRWTISIMGGSPVRFEIEVESDILDVDLYYNKPFGMDDMEFRSYSLDLRPDFTVLARSRVSSERVFLINFDAKYKSQTDVVDEDGDRYETKSWENDICKMHAYRDALLHSCGSFILYPGSKTEVFRKPWRQDDWESRLRRRVPSVGSVSLVPGSDGDPALEHLLRDLLEDISGMAEGEIVFDDVTNYLF